MSRQFNSTQEVDYPITKLTDIISNATDRHVPDLKHNYKLSNDIVEQIKLRNKYRRQHQQHPTDLNKQINKVNSLKNDKLVTGIKEKSYKY